MENIMSLYNLFYYFVIYAMIGWIMEVIFDYYKNRKFVNRGFLYGPFCPIYGVGIVAVFLVVENMIHIFSSTAKISLLAVFLIAMLLMTLVEGLTGALMSSIFHIKWWDYSDRRFNFNGYVCLEFSLLWGVIGTIAIVYFHGRIISLVGNIDRNIGEFIIVVVTVYILIDSTLTVRSMVDFRTLLLEFESVSQEYTLSKNKLMREMLQVKGNLSERLKSEIGKKSNEVNNSLNRIQNHLKTLQSNGIELGNSLKGISNDLIDHDKRLSLRIKFEFKEIQNKYEKLSFKITKNRLYRAFSDMKLIHYKEYPENLSKKRDASRELNNKRNDNE